jgi:hypothetical protein
MKKNISKQKRQPDVPDPQKRVLTIDGVAEALRRLNGNQAAVGRAFGVTRSSVNEFIKNHPELKSVEQECKQSFIDNVESAIYSQALKGNVTAQIFILKTIGKDRGYVERTENKQDHFEYSISDLALLNDYELERLLAGDDPRSVFAASGKRIIREKAKTG